MKNGDSQKAEIPAKAHFLKSVFGEKLGKSWGFNGGKPDV